MRIFAGRGHRYNTWYIYLRPTPHSTCLCEIIPSVLLTYRVGVHWSVARVCPSVQRALTPWMPIKGSITHAFPQLFFYAFLFIVTIMLRWRWIMITSVPGNWEWLRDYLYALTMRSDWFCTSCHFLTDNLLQSADKEQQEMRAVAQKPHDAVVKFDTYRNLQRHCAVLPAIARHLV